MRRWVITLCFLLAFFTTSVDAAPVSSNTASTSQPVTTVSALPAVSPTLAGSTVPSPVPLKSELTSMRWANHLDSATGGSMVRIVMDVAGPVEVRGTIVAEPEPQLIVNIRGAGPGKIETTQKFDGTIVDKVNISENGPGNTKMVIDLPSRLNPGDYKVFTLPSDPKAGRPFRVVVDINKPATVVPTMTFTAGLKNKVIAVDAGHGGSDVGAIGPARTYEKNVTLAMTNQLKSLLEKAGATVVMVRQGDQDVYGPGASDLQELQARTTVANSRKADVFVSIHANAFSDSSVGGVSTYYSQKSPYDSLLAQQIQSSLVDSTKLQDRRACVAGFYLTKNTNMPAVLIETAFISNPVEERLLNSPDFQQRVAQGIVQGLDRFFAQAAKIRGGE